MSSGLLIRFVLRWCITLALPFLLVMASVRLLLSYEFLRYEYTRPGFPPDHFGFTTADRLEYGMYAITFLFSAGAVDELASVMRPRNDMCTGASPCPLFNARELEHLDDVKQALHAAFSLAALCLFAAVVCLMAAVYLQFAADSRLDILSDFRVALRRGASLTLAVFLALAVIGVAAWDMAFDAFHVLFFAAGTWRFPFTDSLIRLYPEQLFVDAALLIAGFAACSSLLILAILRLWEKRWLCAHSIPASSGKGERLVAR